MNIEKIFSVSTKLFNDSIRSILPFILLYSIFVIFLNYFSKFSELSEELIIAPTTFFDIIMLLISYSINLLYSILIIQFIISKKNHSNLKFNLNSIIKTAIKITALYLIIFVPGIILWIITNMIINLRAANIFLLLIPSLYLITFFSQYFIIDKQKNIFESVLLSYNLIIKNVNKFFVLMLINCFFLIVMFYIAIFLGQFMIGMHSMLINVQLYFITIFNIQYYFYLQKLEDTVSFNE